MSLFMNFQNLSYCKLKEKDRQETKKNQHKEPPNKTNIKDKQNQITNYNIES